MAYLLYFKCHPFNTICICIEIRHDPFEVKRNSFNVILDHEIIIFSNCQFVFNKCAHIANSALIIILLS